MTDPSRVRPDIARVPRILRHAALALAIGALSVGPAAAQSLNAGALSGLVRDAAGTRLPEASVTVSDNRTGLSRTLLTPRDGVFRFNLLFPGEYDVLVERFGYRPKLMRRVPVSAGVLVQADFVLESTEAAAVDTVVFSGVPQGGSQVMLAGGAAPDDFAELADQRRLLSSLAGLFPDADADLGAEGLPGRVGALAIDAITRWSPRHPRVPSAALDGIAFPLAALGGAELLPGGFDAEWPGSGGAVLSAFTVPGARALSASLTASGGANAQYGSLLLSGPVVRDTAHFAIGAVATRLAPSVPAPWPGDSVALAAATIAQDSFQTDLSRYASAYQPTSQIVSGFGRFDWLVASDHRLYVRADAASATLDDPDLGPLAPVALGSRLTATDVSVATALASTIGTRAGNELTASLDAGQRDLGTAGLVGTSFTAGFAAGTAALEPGSFKRTTFRVGETFHYRLGAGALKGGVQLAFTSHDQTYDDGRAGVFTFGDTTSFAHRTGAFWQTVGSSPATSFKTSTVGLFAQGLFTPTPQLEVLAGLRHDAEQIPVDAIRGNATWLRATGIDNRAVPKRRALVSPRVAFTWTLGAARRWHVRGEAGTFLEPTDPGEIAEAITHATSTSVRRAFGQLGAWPKVPDSTVAPVAGQALTLLGAQFTPPRSGRVRVGIGGNVGGVLLRVEGAYRHTDFLPVRRDLNLALNPRARDQDGRPLYGTLAQSGALVGVVPGTNRRFAGFDAVSSLDPVGYSDYWGVTLGLEREVERGLSLMASYTYSRTDDNWFGARSGAAEAQLVPLTDTSGAAPWAKGRSDFDVPHRLVLGAELRLAGALAPRLAVLYRWHSGYPFTPGFPGGVDANGDGSGRNDPAFVTDTLAGAADVIASRACLRAQVGSFAARNSCREPGVGSLDLRFALTLGRRGRATSELMVDALNLASSGGDVTDHALYLVDGAGTLVTNPATGVTTVPLIANPNFGNALVRRNPGATWRVGVRVGF